MESIDTFMCPRLSFQGQNTTKVDACDAVNDLYPCWAKDESMHLYNYINTPTWVVVYKGCGQKVYIYIYTMMHGQIKSTTG